MAEDGEAKFINDKVTGINYYHKNAILDIAGIILMALFLGMENENNR